MGLPGYIVFFAYLIGVVVLGARMRREDRSAREFFLAGRSMGWLPIGVSVMVTAFSAINLAAVPTEVSGHGLYMIAALPVFILVGFPVTRIFMPFFHGMRLTSAYAYLERRFDVRVRCLASGLFILWRLMWMAVALHAAALLLSAVSGLDRRLLIFLAGTAAMTYTALGGMRAVMWTDVAQFVVLVAGVGAAVLAVVLRAGDGLGGLMDAAVAGGRIAPFRPWDPEFLSFDPRIRITLWSCVIGTFVAFLARYGADQVVVQRYFTARSLRQAQRGYWLNAFCAIAAISLLAVLGLCVYAHSARAGLLANEKLAPIDHLATLIRSLPAGVTGLFAAGVLAATMSSVDSGINACSAAYVTDFHKRFLAVRSVDDDKVDRSRISGPLLTLDLGLVAICLALVVGRLGISVFEIANRIINGLGTPLLAIMLAGMFSRRANGAGVLVGGTLGAVASVAVSFGAQNLALQYYAVVNFLVTLGACYAVSLIAEAGGNRATEENLAWTWAARRSKGHRHEDGEDEG